jgi:3-dehydroquinate synthase class II
VHSGGGKKLVWLSTASQAALTAALEAGVDTVVFEEEQAALAEEWQRLGRFQAVTRTADGRLVDGEGEQVQAHGHAWAGVLAAPLCCAGRQGGFAAG